MGRYLPPFGFNGHRSLPTIPSPLVTHHSLQIHWLLTTIPVPPFSPSIRPQPEGPTVIETIGIPATWTWASLDQVCPIFSDCPHRTPRYSPTGYPALRPRDVVDGKLALDRSAKVSLSEYQLQTSKRAPRPGDVIYSRELSFGWAVTVPEELLSVCRKVWLSCGLPMTSMFGASFTRSIALSAESRLSKQLSELRTRTSI